MFAHEVHFVPITDLSIISGTQFSVDEHADLHAEHVEPPSEGEPGIDLRPHSLMVTPIFRDMYAKDEVVANLVSSISFDSFMSQLLPDGVTGIDLVIKNSCGVTHSYSLSGDRAKYLGSADLHDPRCNDKEVVIAFAPDLGDPSGEPSGGSLRDESMRCAFTFNAYPNAAFVEKYSTNLPAMFASVVAALFLVLIVAFGVFDWQSQRRHDKVFDQAARSNAIVSSLFPAQVRDQLYQERGVKQQKMAAGGTESQLKTFMLEEEQSGDNTTARHHDDDDIILPGKPLAELFPEATIMFADLAGFTAWSSVREPAQVFILLETLYRAFDKVAKCRRIFKVETIGDCYVAVCG